MKQTVTFSFFVGAFEDMDRLDNFSYDGLRVLYDFFEQWDENIELDVIAFCCEFSEATPDEIRENFGIDLRGSELLDYLNEHTLICGETSDTIVYQDF